MLEPLPGDDTLLLVRAIRLLRLRGFLAFARDDSRLRSEVLLPSALMASLINSFSSIQ